MTGHGMRHGLHIRGTLGELRLPQDATPWVCDNHGATQAATIGGFSGGYGTRGYDAQVYTRTRKEEAI